MGAVWTKIRSDLRSSLGTSIAAILVIGLAGGLVLGAAMAARRTETAYPRFLVATNASDLLVSPSTPGGLEGFDQAVGKLPGVTSSGLIGGLNVFGPIVPGQNDLKQQFSTNASVDGRAFYTIDRPKLIAGRLPRRDRADEVLIDTTAASTAHLTVGSRMQMAALTSFPADGSSPGPANITRVNLTVVGIGIRQEAILPSTLLDAQPDMVFSPAFYRMYSGPRLVGYDGVLVRLRPGTDPQRFTAQANGLAASFHAEPIFISNRARHAEQVRRAILPQAIALWMFAGLLGAGLLLVTGLVLARRLFAVSLEHPILRTLGMTRGQLMAGALTLVGTVAVAGTAMAAIVAILSSAFTPFGAARLAEPDPGTSVSWALLAEGSAAIVGSLIAVAAFPAWRAASVPSGSMGLGELAGANRPSVLASQASRGSLPPSAGVGIRMALEPGRGRTAVPVRSGTVGLAVAVAALTAAFTFGTNLTRLVSTPRLYGWNWDVMFGSPFGFGPAPVGLLDHVPGVAAYAGGDYGHVLIAGQPVPAVGLDPTAGIFPTSVVGRDPRSDDEIVLGAKDLRRIHGTVGDTIAVGIGDRTRRMRIVGQAVFPALGQGTFEPTGLGDGAVVTAATLLSTSSDLSADHPYHFALVRLAPGTDPKAFRQALASAARQEPECHPPDADPPCILTDARPPGDITSYSGIAATPFVLAGILSALAFALMAYTLLTSVRRRRRDLAVLKTMGFVRRQVSAAVAWQATTLAAVAGVIGMPLGVVTGRWAWSLFTTGLGVPPTLRIPVVLLSLAVPGGVLAANAIAAIPGRIAGRTHPAVALRAE